jgi:hypothetical protein
MTVNSATAAAKHPAAHNPSVYRLAPAALDRRCIIANSFTAAEPRRDYKAQLIGSFRLMFFIILF